MHLFNQHLCSVRRSAAVCIVVAILHATLADVQAIVLPTADGFYGIWYAVGASGDQYAYKYSGGLGTYTQQTSPFAIYAPAVNRTYFVYGGTNGTANSLRNYLSYYDHNTGLLARPREVRNVGGTDNHKNITLAIDDAGYLNVFGNSHGNAGTGNYYKSAQPYSIADFNEIPLPGSVFNSNAGAVKLAYSNAFYVSGKGYMLIYNEYDDGRAAHTATSPDGISWTEQELLDTEQGHYTVARQNGSTIGVSADYHRNGSLDHRTNLYYMQTSNFGQTWTNASGDSLSLPLTARNNPALVHDYYAENQMVYMKDIDYDAGGNPILLYLTVSDATGTGYKSGPQPGGRTVHTARWTGSTWDIRDVMNTDHNYDHGELNVEADGSWRITAPFIDGPQQYGTGGEVGVWTSQNQGASWQLANQITQGSQYNQTYVRHPVNAQPGFYDYWADGNAFATSTSRLYFTTKDGAVYRMPTHFTGDFAAPELVPLGPQPPDPPDPPNPPNPNLRCYEGFDYPNTGSAQAVGLNGGTGWGGAWTAASLGDGFTVSQDNVSMSSAAFPMTPVGDRLIAAGAGSGANSMRVSRLLPSTFNLGQDGVLYASLLLKKTGSATAMASSNNMEVNLTAGESGNGTVRFGSTSDNRLFIYDSGSVPASATFEDVVVGQTYFVVLKLDAHETGNDIASVLVVSPNEAVPTIEPITWDVARSFNSAAVIDRIRLWIGTLAAGQFDELRVGSSWASVTGGLTGDYNGDGSVDAADYIVWRKSNSSNQQAYLDWRTHYGESNDVGDDSASGSMAAVPEPAIWPMLVAAGFLTAALAGRTRSVRKAYGTA